MHLGGLLLELIAGCSGRETGVFELTGDEAGACEVLAHLVGKQFKILEFRQSKADLEDIFMTVTKGGVQ